MEPSPIFIGGLSFSGKTQLRLMLNMHPDIYVLRRAKLWNHLDAFGDLSQPAALDHCLKTVLAQKSLQAYALDPSTIRLAFLEGPPTYAHLFGVIYAACARFQGKTRWGEQLGFIEKHFDRIIRSYPNARMVHMVRDPRRRYLESIENKHPRRGRAGWELARWRKSIRFAQENNKRYPEHYLIVHYENLASERERTLRRVAAFLGVSYKPDMLWPNDPIHFRQDALPAAFSRELAFIQQFAARELDQLGYGKEMLGLGPWDRIAIYGYDLPINFATGLAWQLLHGGDPG